MAESILNQKKILAADDEPWILDMLGEELLKECPAVKLDTACTFKEATAMLALSSYDLVILDVEGVRGLDLLKQAVDRGMPAIVFSANPLTPSPLKESFKLGARGFLPKEKLGEIVPFLELVLQNKNLFVYDELLRDYLSQVNPARGQRLRKLFRLICIWRPSSEKNKRL